ncbi:MAG: 4Fe-4S binding protein [Candidatus Ranarchaeia archaeon]
MQPQTTEENVSEPRIGVYICHCGINIASTVNVEEVAHFAQKLPHVVIAKTHRFMCSAPGQSLIQQDIKEYNLNRVVVASCSPLMHESTFREAVHGAGMNPYLFQMANIREQCSWVTNDKEKATEKAKRLVSAAVSRVALHKAIETIEVPVTPSALVIGGGIAGIESALQMADAGHHVYLVEKEPSIGGHMARFNKVFPTIDCSACILTPKMNQVGHHEHITLLTNSEVVKIDGFVGNYKATILTRPTYVDPDKCTACADCEEVCPIDVPDAFNHGMATRKAIYRQFPQAQPATYVIDRDACCECMQCVEVCQPEAIDHSQEETRQVVDVGAIIVATGHHDFDAERVHPLGYKRFDNVITTSDFERLSASDGPTGGRILLKNGQEPKHVAIIHCVGSRNKNYREYCSRVCCMVALKTAFLCKEIIGRDTKVTECYIDMRAYGKGFEEFYNRLRDMDVHFLHGIPSEIHENPDKTLSFEVWDSSINRQIRVTADMVILSIGLEPRKDADHVQHALTLSCSSDEFFLEKHPKLAPVSTAIDGIYLAGTCQGPKDIPDTVAQAGAAAANVLSLFGKGKVEIEPTLAVVNEEKCSGCKICIDRCPYDAIRFDDDKNVANIQGALCKGCGICVAACPSSAITQKGYTDQQILNEIQSLLKDYGVEKA